MTFELQHYVRKSFNVDCIQVTADNMESVARWCKGEIRVTEPRNPAEAKKYVYLDVPKARDDRHQRAYIGDWVLRMHNGYKFYNNRAFHDAFELPSTATTPTDIGMDTNSASGFFATVLSHEEREALKLVTAFKRILSEPASSSERAS